MRLLLRAGLLAVLLFSQLVPGALAVEEDCPESVKDDCPESVSLVRVVVQRELSGRETKELLDGARPKGAGPARPRTGTWVERKYEFYCTHDRLITDDGQTCSPCPEGQDRYSIQERTVTDGTPRSSWRILGYSCLSAADLGGAERITITPGMVLREFQALEWPKAPLVLEPGKGMTLVNMATNAFSENSGPLTQTVPMFGRSVEIEATPDTWTWHWGDGTVDSTTFPGQPRPTGGVSHAYVRAAERVDVRVDLTYVGRFRVEGGPWVAIPEPRTMRGDSQTLSVREAVTQLVR